MRRGRRLAGRAAILASALRRCVATVIPRSCVFCGCDCLPAEAGLCSGCFRDLPWLGPHCGRCAEPLAATGDHGRACAACQANPPPFTAAVAAFRYDFPVDAAIRALKFRRRLDYVPVFAALMAALASTLPADIDAVQPVPLHWRRRFRRGFNQAAELARPVARVRRLPLVDAVTRLRATRYQAGLAAAERRRNLEGAFGIRGSLRARHVLIVDDVVTTGATCRQLAEVLLAAGAAEVSLLALARAGQDGLNA